MAMKHEHAAQSSGRRQLITAGERCLQDLDRYALGRAEERLSHALSGRVPKQMRRSGTQPWNLIRSSCLNFGDFEVDNGRLALLKGDSRGWERYWLGCRFQILSEAVWLLELQKTELRSTDTNFPDGVRLLACAVLMQDLELADLLFSSVLPISWTHRTLKTAPEAIAQSQNQFPSPDENPTAVRTLYNYSLVGLDPMLLRLVGRRLGRPLQLPDQPEFAALGPYAPILEAWDDPEVIETTLKWMCEDRLVDSRVMRLWAVASPNPWIIIPVEILTIYRVRKDMGKETPIFLHPVLEAPFDHLPDKVIRLSDPRLDQTVAWAKERYPELADAVF
jgi:hypothetical protein